MAGYWFPGGHHQHQPCLVLVLVHDGHHQHQPCLVLVLVS